MQVLPVVMSDIRLASTKEAMRTGLPKDLDLLVAPLCGRACPPSKCGMVLHFLKRTINQGMLLDVINMRLFRIEVLGAAASKKSFLVMPAYLKYHLISSSSAANNFKHDDGPAGDHLIVPHRLYSYMLTACNQSK